MTVAARDSRGRPLFPFGAIVGQESMKLALVLNAIDPRIGGVLIRGEKGTAKSTAARALATVLARIDPAARLVTLPLNASEDMVVGGIDFSATVACGSRVFQPGILANADRGILYIDEVNLLEDSLVDIILSAAESGVNVVEREGISFRHEARFALVGTMNPEEGALRPQLLDRFGLCVEVAAERDPERRVMLMERREAYEADPAAFRLAYSDEERLLAEHLSRARDSMRGIRLPPSIESYISELATSRHVAGHRADLAIRRAAIALAAWRDRGSVLVEDVLAVADMALRHRERDAFPPPQAAPPPPPPPRNEENADGERQEQTPPPDASPAPELSDASPPIGDSAETLLPIGDTFRVKQIEPAKDRAKRRGSGRRTRTRTDERLGRYVRSRQASDSRALALDATLRAAAPYQRARRGARPGIVIRRGDWQEKVREKRIGSFILFVVDASGSMGARARMVASKGAIMSLLLDAYQKRDKVSLITFRRTEAQLLLPPTSSIDIAARVLRELPVGGRTPLAAGLVKAYETLRPFLRRDPTLRPLVMLVSDGKANVGFEGGGSGIADACRIAEMLGQDGRVRWVVIDTEDPRGVRLRLAGRIADALAAEYFRIEDLQAGDLVQIVKAQA